MLLAQHVILAKFYQDTSKTGSYTDNPFVRFRDSQPLVFQSYGECRDADCDSCFNIRGVAHIITVNEEEEQVCEEVNYKFFCARVSMGRIYGAGVGLLWTLCFTFALVYLCCHNYECKCCSKTGCCCRCCRKEEEVHVKWGKGTKLPRPVKFVKPKQKRSCICNGND